MDALQKKGKFDGITKLGTAMVLFILIFNCVCEDICFFIYNRWTWHLINLLGIYNKTTSKINNHYDFLRDESTVYFDKYTA